MAGTNGELCINGSETAPLLQDRDDESIQPELENGPAPPYSGASPPPYTDDPPPYTPSVMYNSDPTIVCRVCQQLIPIRGRENQSVIKCSNCREATPIKPPPEGKKYIRCPCNALLTCKTTSTRISCPRTNCKRIITVGSTVPSTSHVIISSNNTSHETRIRVSCGHCNETFIFRNTAHLARCPHCHRISSVGSSFARNRALIFAMIGLLFLAVGVGVTVATMEMAAEKGGIYVVWVGAFIAGLLNLIRSCYYCTMTVSQTEGAV